MRTSVEISDSLLEEARKVIAREGTTLRALTEQGLRRVVAERRQRAGPLRVRKASFRGEGLQPGVAGASWERLREMADEGRGGMIARGGALGRLHGVRELWTVDRDFSRSLGLLVGNLLVSA
jgi:hypothetical protein